MGMGVDILGVPKEELFKNKHFEGFLGIDKFDYSPIMEGKSTYALRTEELERDDSFQQLIPYVWLVNSVDKKVFLYKRSKEGNEGRLHDRYSGGVGGHVDKVDGMNPRDLLVHSMMRELEEEVEMDKYPSPNDIRVVGYLNYDTNVEAVHFGIVSVAETTSDAKPKEHMSHGRFYSLEEADKIISDSSNDVEKWTLASWPHIKEILSR